MSESEIQSHRVNQFDRACPGIHPREHLLNVYLNLRDRGDSHAAALLAVTTGPLLPPPLTAAEHNAFPKGRWTSKS